MEFIVWLAILVIYSIVQGMAEKKKKQQRKQAPQGDMPELPEGRRPTTLKEALREIQEALQQAQQQTQAPEPVPPPPPAPPKRKTPALARREPEFHSMESTIENRSLEAQTKYTSTYSQRVLEKKKTYEDSFPKSTFSDDRFSHAHPETPDLIVETPKQTNTAANSLKAALSDQKSIREAFLLSEILGKPKSLQR